MFPPMPPGPPMGGPPMGGPMMPGSAGPPPLPPGGRLPGPGAPMGDSPLLAAMAQQLSGASIPGGDTNLRGLGPGDPNLGVLQMLELLELGKGGGGMGGSMVAGLGMPPAVPFNQQMPPGGGAY